MLARGGKPKQVHRPWTDDENEIIRRHYRDGLSVILPMLPGRNRHTVRKQAQKLRVFMRVMWTKAEEKKLEFLWGTGLGLAWIARKINRSPGAILSKAAKLGLGLGRPQGYESLTSAVRRTGLSSTDGIRRVLRWAGVTIHITRATKRVHHKGRYRTHFVDPFDVDEAIAKWHTTETVAGAARARDMPHPTLYEWLVKAGEITPTVGPRRKHHRLPSEVIDRVVAERRSRRAS